MPSIRETSKRKAGELDSNDVLEREATKTTQKVPIFFVYVISYIEYMQSYYVSTYINK